MGKHYALGNAGRAGGIDNGGEIVGAMLRRALSSGIALLWDHRASCAHVICMGGLDWIHDDDAFQAVFARRMASIFRNCCSEETKIARTPRPAE